MRRLGALGGVAGLLFSLLRGGKRQENFSSPLALWPGNACFRVIRSDLGGATNWIYSHSQQGKAGKHGVTGIVFLSDPPWDRGSTSLLAPAQVSKRGNVLPALPASCLLATAVRQLWGQELLYIPAEPTSFIPFLCKSCRRKESFSSAESTFACTCSSSRLFPVTSNEKRNSVGTKHPCPVQHCRYTVQASLYWACVAFTQDDSSSPSTRGQKKTKTNQNKNHPRKRRIE